MNILEKQKKTKRFLFKELSLKYKIHHITISRLLKSFDLKTVNGAISAIRLLDNKYKID